METLNHENGRTFKGFPHVEWLEMRTHETDSGVVLLSVPYQDKLIGDKESRVIHGGVVTTLLDTGCGMAAIMKTGLMGFVATLSLRVDYMRPAKPDHVLWARCECYRVTRSVAFTRGLAYDDDPNDPVATSAGSFMLTKPKFKKAAK